MSAELVLISAGAAKGLVDALAPAWAAETGAPVRGTFGAVGAMKEQLLARERCDVVILTEPLLEGLARDAMVDGDSIRPLGRVRTGVAVPAAAPDPAIGDRDALRDALSRASAIFLPDPERATAGIHFAKVLRELGLAQTLASRLRPYPNGATAMRAMAEANDAAAIGCTQVTEVLYTPGVRLVGPLPREFELSTVYAAGVCRRAASADLARAFVGRLAAPALADLRTRGGFEPVG